MENTEKMQNSHLAYNELLGFPNKVTLEYFRLNGIFCHTHKYVFPPFCIIIQHLGMLSQLDHSLGRLFQSVPQKTDVKSGPGKAPEDLPTTTMRRKGCLEPHIKSSEVFLGVCVF